jgi:hypothetical protein
MMMVQKFTPWKFRVPMTQRPQNFILLVANLWLYMIVGDKSADSVFLTAIYLEYVNGLGLILMTVLGIICATYQTIAF